MIIRLLTVILITGIACSAFSQPLNGSYTVGGQSPDFVTLQQAADALNSNGVSGEVFFNIRPGVYSKNGGNNTVLVLDSTVAGLSPSNRITFQPDAAAGGNVNNVILEMNINDVNTADRHIVLVELDYITFQNLTFQENDSSQHIFNFTLVRLQRVVNLNDVIEGITFEGCNFIGTAPSGTDQGIQFGQSVGDITIRGNVFTRLLRAIYGSDVFGVVHGTLSIEDNQFLAGWRSASGSGNQLGSAMQLYAANLIIRRNIIDFESSFNGGYTGIFVTVPVGSETISIEQNSIKGLVSRSIDVTGAGGNADTLVIANNMINVIAHPVWANQSAVGISISQNPGNVQIVFNTIVVHGTTLVGLYAATEDCLVLNNIVIIRPSAGFSVCYDQGNNQSINLQSDYNVIFMLGAGSSGPLVIRNGVQYPSLSAYQTATGLDTNSISKDLDFVDSTNLHLTDCQSQDPELKGVPVEGITIDFDSEIRSTDFPMIGADENSVRMLDMFVDPFKAGLAGTAFSVATGDFDEDGDDDIAVPDYDNRQVLIYLNQQPNRSFVHSGTLFTTVQPVVVKFYDLDEDGHLDLIAGGDTSAVIVFWGDGNGGTTGSEMVGTFGRVRSLEPGPVFVGNIKRTIAITEDNGFLPNTSTLGYLMHLGGRVLCHDVQYAPGNIPPDTINAVMTDFVIGDLAGDGGSPEIAAVTSFPLPHPLILISNITFLASAGPPCADIVPRGDITEYQLGTGVGSTAGHSNIITGDFDGDTDLDIITLETFSSCLFIKNEGNLTFSSQSIDVKGAQGLVSMDYENDGDLDFITVNELLETNGITVFLNDGTGDFIPRENCFFPLASGRPYYASASDFDLDGKTDIVLVSSSATDSLFVLYNLGGGTVGISDQDIKEIPADFSLSQNYPNPFNPSTVIEYTLPSESNVRISIFNILGEKVKEVVNAHMSAGIHSVNFNADNLTSGIYIYRIEARDLTGSFHFITAKKMMLLK